MRCETCGRLDPWFRGEECYCRKTPNQLKRQQPATGEALKAWLVRENERGEA